MRDLLGNSRCPQFLDPELKYTTSRLVCLESIQGSLIELNRARTVSLANPNSCSTAQCIPNLKDQFRSISDTKISRLGIFHSALFFIGGTKKTITPP